MELFESLLKILKEGNQYRVSRWTLNRFRTGGDSEGFHGTYSEASRGLSDFAGSAWGFQRGYKEFRGFNKIQGVSRRARGFQMMIIGDALLSFLKILGGSEGFFSGSFRGV